MQNWANTSGDFSPPPHVYGTADVAEDISQDDANQDSPWAELGDDS